MVRLRELTVQAASDTIGMEERGYMDKEYKELVNEIQRISEQTEFNGQRLLSSDSVPSLSIQVGYNNAPEDTLTLSFKGDNGEGVDTHSLGLAETSLVHTTGKEVAANLDILDSAFQKLARNRAHLGATESRLQSAISSIEVKNENMMAANSRIRDVDYASETAEMVKSRMLTQAGMAVLQTANSTPEMAMQLLRQ
jgi:flagellin